MEALFALVSMDVETEEWPLCSKCLLLRVREFYVPTYCNGLHISSQAAARSRHKLSQKLGQPTYMVHPSLPWISKEQ